MPPKKPSPSPSFNALAEWAELPPVMLSMNSTPWSVVVASLNFSNNSLHCVFAISLCLLSINGGVMIATAWVNSDAYRDVKAEKSSVITFDEVIFD